MGSLAGLTSCAGRFSIGLKKADELMRAIQFCTTPKGYLPHYSYIFRNPEPLGTEMNNVACSRLGTMLYLDIQRGKDDMKTSIFLKYLGGTAVCIRRIMMDIKGCDELTSIDTHFYDNWSIGVKMAEEVMAWRVNYYRPVKTSHKGFCIDTFKRLIKDWSGEPYLVMKSTSRVLVGRPIMTIGYKYNSRKVLGFIATEGGGSTEPSDPYLSCFPDCFCNVDVLPIVIS